MSFKLLKRKRTKNRRFGTATVEMAVIAPVIFLLIFVQIEFARLMMVRQSVTNAAREGCRHASLVTTRDSDDSEKVVREFVAHVIGTSLANSEFVEVSYEPSFSSSPDHGTTITTTVDIDFDSVSWLPPFFAKGTTIHASAEMDRE